ncbi:lactate utilization protein [Arcobacter roscoffensis]|uniref:Lactate utilization protein n=1 Tax=Arcobacter roscoffensis TaxID=2961520 RepID=A0ABY5E768_9BACT|nr:lactate utilization protein [Arcobacter roscoffensis]UTJ07497.1 lactate utilization protein [Arcobacter roscoffensis]
MQKLINTLESCGYKVHNAKDKKEALEISKIYIKEGISVGLGGSTSVGQIGLLDFLVNNKNITLYNQYEKGISMEENTKRRREGMLTDLYVTGTNALTKDGKLVNADGSGNRVAAMIFGPKKVLVIVGKNKIVNSVEEGFDRVMNVAAVKNIDRMNKKAIEMGKEPRHNLDNAANKFTYIKADEKDRIVLILVDEELGF